MTKADQLRERSYAFTESAIRRHMVAPEVRYSSAGSPASASCPRRSGRSRRSGKASMRSSDCFAAARVLSRRGSAYGRVPGGRVRLVWGCKASRSGACSTAVLERLDRQLKVGTRLTRDRVHRRTAAVEDGLPRRVAASVEPQRGSGSLPESDWHCPDPAGGMAHAQSATSSPVLGRDRRCARAAPHRRAARRA
jgi:hypothetical protein